MRPTARPGRRVGSLLRGATLILVTVCLVTSVAAQIRHLDPAAVLDAYAQGRYDEALTPVRLATRDQAREFLQRLVVSGGQWVDSVPSERSRRALIAAAFALEAERIRAERGEWADRENDESCAGRCVIEWACTLIQTRGAPDEAERTWMLASIALAGGVRDWTFLQNPLSRPTEKRGERGHVLHAIARMPDEPRFRLARAVALASRQAVTSEMDIPRDGARTEQMADPYSRAIERSPFLVSVLEQRRATLGDYAREQFDALVSDPSVGTEARLRIGYLHWVRGDAAEALSAQRVVAEAAQDPDLKYLANFLAAQAAQALGDLRAAEMHYTAALGARPHSQSAALGLAALLYSRGEATQAYDLVSAAREGRPRDDDSWRLFLYGDFAKLPALVGELRRVVQP